MKFFWESRSRLFQPSSRCDKTGEIWKAGLLAKNEHQCFWGDEEAEQDSGGTEDPGSKIASSSPEQSS